MSGHPSLLFFLTVSNDPQVKSYWTFRKLRAAYGYRKQTSQHLTGINWEFAAFFYVTELVPHLKPQLPIMSEYWE